MSRLKIIVLIFATESTVELAGTVMEETVLVMKALKILEMFVWTYVKESTVELEVIA